MNRQLLGIKTADGNSLLIVCFLNLDASCAAAVSICSPFGRSFCHFFVRVSCRKHKLSHLLPQSPDLEKARKAARRRRTSSCPSGRDAIRRPGLRVVMTCPDKKSRLSPTQPHLQQVGSAGAVVGHGGGFLQVPLQLPGTAQ